MRDRRQSGFAVALTAAVLFAGSAFAFTGQQFANEAKISLAKARTIALKAQPGKISDQELEHEKGGSGLRYSFDVVTKSGKTHEVGVDAQSGRVLENSIEGPNSD